MKIRLLLPTDIDAIVASFEQAKWPKPRSTFHKYLKDQENGRRIVWVAYVKEHVAGYVTLNWESAYQPFFKQKIPEIMDLNVLPVFRNQGIGAKLLETAETEAAHKSSIVGIGVGLYEGYGAAQKLYIKRGYIPDGRGITYKYKLLKYGDKESLDDDLVLWFTKELKSTKNAKNKYHVYKTYEKIAKWMDDHRSKTLFEKPYLDRVISYLTADATILDLGCGTGQPIGQYFVDAGFKVIGVDGSAKMLEIGKSRCPKIKFILADMRTLNLGIQFDCIIAWHSFFHLTQNDQRDMFKIFTSHLKKNGILLLTTDSEAGEIWSDNGGEKLYHASLSATEYKTLFQQHKFELIDYKIADPECGDATVWLARLT